MSKSTAPSSRKIGGGYKNKRRDKRKRELIEVPMPVQIGETRTKSVRTLGGHAKIKPLKVKFGNMFDPTSKKLMKVEMIRVLDNKANRSYARRNIITKGSVIETKEGSAVVVNRPGQDGQVTLRKVVK